MTTEVTATAGYQVADSYRPEIDGLRAVAILSVVLYHVGIPRLSYGFLGVDIFFVISGYLITSQLLANTHLRPAQVLLSFYARRARRILPALYVVVFASLLLGRFLLLPDGEQQDLDRSALAAVLFVSNILFWNRSLDYFAPDAEQQPLLHLWSLAVEEQFYLLWPVILILIERIGFHTRRNMTVTASVTLTASLFLLWVFLETTSPQTAFFMLSGRAWELGVGASLAAARDYRVFLRSPRLLATLGFGLIVAGLLSKSSDGPWSSFSTMAVVTGTAILIACAPAARGTTIYGLLTCRFMRTTGQLSYAWYLWHWPLLAFARVVDLGNHQLLRDGLLGLLAYVLAYGSTHYFETPIRQRRLGAFASDPRSLVSGGVMAAACVFLAIGCWAAARTTYRQDFQAPLLAETTECAEPYLNDKIEPTAPCIIASGNAASLFLIGDSFANHWEPALKDWAQGTDFYVVERVMSACNILIAGQLTPEDSLGAALRPGCREFATRVWQDIQQASQAGRPVGVVASTVWPRGEKAAAEIASPLETAVTFLEDRGVRVLLIKPSPLFPFAVPACVARRSADACRIPVAPYVESAAPINKLLDDIAARHANVRLFDPLPRFCDENWCYPTQDGVVSFIDKGHLSRPAATASASSLAPLLAWLVSRP